MSSGIVLRSVEWQSKEKNIKAKPSYPLPISSEWNGLVNVEKIDYFLKKVQDISSLSSPLPSNTI